MNPIMSITCTCIHGGGGHAEACAFFTPTKEQYLEACAERDKLRKVAREALKVCETSGSHVAIGEAIDKLQAAIDALNVTTGATATPVRPWWFKYE